MTTTKPPSPTEVLKTKKPSEDRCSCRESATKCPTHGQSVKSPLYRHWTLDASNS